MLSGIDLEAYWVAQLEAEDVLKEGQQMRKELGDKVYDVGERAGTKKGLVMASNYMLFLADALADVENPVGKGMVSTFRAISQEILMLMEEKKEK